MHGKNAKTWAALIGLASLALATASFAADKLECIHPASGANADPGLRPIDGHENHAPPANHGYRRSVQSFSVPALTLTTMDGNAVRLDELLDGDRPVLLNFIYTSCRSVCPVLSATFAEFRDLLDAQTAAPAMVSITIDPEYDTPARLKSYAERFGAGPEWVFLTGGAADILTVQRAFDAYRGDKMNHIPLTFIRPAKEKPWIRLQGFTSAAELAIEYHGVLAQAR